MVVHLPAFRLERCGFGAEEFAAVIGEWKSAVRIVAATPAARCEGVLTGITATEARALVPDIALVQWNANEEEIDRTALCQRFEAFSDRVEALCDPAWDDALGIDVTWTARGDEHGHAERAVALAHSLGHTARAAVADDLLAARAFAEWSAPDGGVFVAAPGASAKWLAPLPVSALVTDPELIRSLRALGIERIGEWARLDPAAFAHRHGHHAARLQQVARGLAGPRRPPALPVASDIPVVRVSLAGATTQQEVVRVLPSALETIEHHLRDRDRAAVRLRILLTMEPRHTTLKRVSTGGLPPTGETADPQAIAISVRVGRPTRNPRVLHALIVARLERLRVDGGFEPGPTINELAIEVVESAPEVGWQPGLADRTEGGESLPEVVARLVDQLGEHSVFFAQCRETWRPEDAWTAVRPAPLRVSQERTLERDKRLDPVLVQEAHERHENFPLPRPTILLPDPRRCDVQIVDARPDVFLPIRLHTDRGWQPITEHRGPERISGDWWTPQPFDREYWSIRCEGGWMWVFRDRANNQWFLHGFFD